MNKNKIKNIILISIYFYSTEQLVLFSLSFNFHVTKQGIKGKKKMKILNFFVYVKIKLRIRELRFQFFL